MPPPCQKPQGVLDHPYSSEALREFMHQKSLARQQQAMKEKASAVRALELRNQRLQDVYRKQREAVLSKAIPVVSQTTPGIVTFFPHCAQSRVGTGCGEAEEPGSSATEPQHPPVPASLGLVGLQRDPVASAPALQRGLPGVQPETIQRSGLVVQLRHGGPGSCGQAGF